MKHLKKYNESFGMHRDKCDRCGESTNGTTTMSIFNEDVICMDCKKEEKSDPEYDAAVKAEYEETMKGNRDFKGAIPNYKPIRRN
jgi:hypothetical protein